MDQARVDDILVLNTTNKVLIDSVIFFSVCKQPSVSTVQDLVEMLKKKSETWAAIHWSGTRQMS